MRAFKHRSTPGLKPMGYLFLISIGMIMTGCGASQLSLQPDIKSARPSSADPRMHPMQPASQTGPPARRLPAMTGEEHERMGDALLVRGDLHAAYLHYEKALQIGPGTIRLEYKKGLTLLKAGQGPEAARQFQTVLDKNPRYAPAHEGLGRALLLQKKVAGAKTHFIQALALDDRLWRAHNHLGTIYDREGQWKKAAHAYHAAIALQPRQGAVYNNLGMSYLMAGQYASAVEAFQNAITHGCSHAKAYNNLGVALARMGRYEAAFEAFKKAGGEPQAYNNLGCIFMKEGRFDKAVAYFEKAIAMEPAYYVKASENLKRAKAAQKEL
jgi:Flp pilus assembly protein TadD